MTKRSAKHQKTNSTESDAVYFLKLILYFMLGSFWVRISGLEALSTDIALPLGLVVGLYFARHDHFQVDRKIEYAVLFVSTIISYYLPIGLLV